MGVQGEYFLWWKHMNWRGVVKIKDTDAAQENLVAFPKACKMNF